MNQKSVPKCLPFGMQHHKDSICDMGTQMYLVLSELISARQEIYCKKILKPKGNVYIVQILCLHLLLCPNVFFSSPTFYVLFTVMAAILVTFELVQGFREESNG